MIRKNTLSKTFKTLKKETKIAILRAPMFSFTSIVIKEETFIDLAKEKA